MLTSNFLPIAELVPIELDIANKLLVEWKHKMGALERGDQGAWCHALLHNGEPVAVTTASYLISARVGNAPMLVRENTVELSRLCAARPGLCRVMLRMWREFVFPTLKFPYAMSYQDADAHTGNTYRFDGWKRVAYARSGPDTRSGRPGRNKWVWVWPVTEALR
jgi:antitoxin VapB